jgi:dihydroorotase
MPGVETFLPLMIDSVNKGLLDWTDVARLCSAGASNIFGLVNKGIIEEGKDADLVIIDRKKVWEIKASKLHSKCAWTPFEGRKLKGKIDSVFRGGKLAIDKGKLLAKPGQGKYIAPER